MTNFYSNIFWLVRNPIWSCLIHFGQIWSKKFQNETAIFILFKNVATYYTNIFWYVQSLSSFSFGQMSWRNWLTNHGKMHRHQSSNSSLDFKKISKKLTKNSKKAWQYCHGPSGPTCWRTLSKSIALIFLDGGAIAFPCLAH